MLTTVQAARGLAMLMSWMCPSCRLPMVGTNTLLGTRCRRARRSAAECMTSIRLSGRERMLRPRKIPGLHFLDVELDRALDGAGRPHEVLDELRLLAGVDVEHVVQHQHLARAVHAGADADRGYGDRRGDVARQHRRYRFQHDHAGAGPLELLRLPQQALALGF